MKLKHLSVLLLAISWSLPAFAEDSLFCVDENYQKINPLYQNRNPGTAKILFQILSCGGQISKASKRDQLIALVGGYMRENPSLIEHLYASANSASQAEAAKLFLDALWFCSTKECKNRLKKKPFQLPTEDVNNLLAELPPNPFTMAIKDPASLDFLWGYHFGTGDTKIVKRIFDLLSENWEELNSSEPMGANKRMLLSSARWSLVSIASQHLLVREVLENEKTIVAEELLKEATPKS